MLQEFSPEDRRRVQRLMTTLVRGMEMDLTVFPGNSAADLTALKTLDALDGYTYYVAGCVGEFWTDLMCAYRRGLTSWNVRTMAEVGVRFGKGLQLTNVVKDIAHDLQRGRCYVPEPMLAEHGLKPRDLLDLETFLAFGLFSTNSSGWPSTILTKVGSTPWPFRVTKPGCGCPVCGRSFRPENRCDWSARLLMC